MKEMPPSWKFQYEDLTPATKKEITCLADNIYHEARGEKPEGMKWVAYVTINRYIDDRWPDSICEVVRERYKNVCQFSWVCDPPKKVIELEMYEKCKQIAVETYLSFSPEKDVTGGATFYHALSVKPGWENVTFIRDVGRHRYYKG